MSSRRSWSRPLAERGRCFVGACAGSPNMSSRRNRRREQPDAGTRRGLRSRFPIGDGPQRRPLRVLQDAETAHCRDVGRWVQYFAALCFGLTGDCIHIVDGDVNAPMRWDALALRRGRHHAADRFTADFDQCVRHPSTRKLLGVPAHCRNAWRRLHPSSLKVVKRGTARSRWLPREP